jgi:hypothetical protein
MLVQDFEGTFPPTGWDTSSAPGGGQGGVTLIPWHKDGDYFYSGAFGTAYGWGYSLNGWLRILNLNLSSVSTASLSFWWESSYYWHVNPYDNGDLFVEVSTDNGVSWDTLWTFGDSANIVQSGVPWPWENFVWYHSTVSLTAYAGNANVRVGFHVVADDNADIGMDSVAVDTTRTGIIESGIQAAPSGFIGCMQNPTRDNPVIVYNVNNPGPVQIRVFDNLGRQINCLVNRLETPGRKTVLWITDDLPRGVYNLKLEANGMMYFKQLVLIR